VAASLDRVVLPVVTTLGGSHCGLCDAVHTEAADTVRRGSAHDGVLLANHGAVALG
jgi:hypothetical protein